MSRGVCHLTAAAQNGRTVLRENYCTAPFKVMRPFREGNRTKAVLMTASAGILSGDRQELRFTVGDGADLTVTGQGYTKLFCCENEPSGQCITASVAPGGALRYLPRPVTPFGGSDFSGRAEVSLTAGSRLVWSEIVSAGRIGMGERFRMKRYHSRLLVKREGVPVFLDHCLLTPERTDYSSAGFFDGYSHMGMLYLFGGADETALLSAIRALPFAGRMGASRAREGIVVRALADRGERIESLFAAVTALPGCP